MRWRVQLTRRAAKELTNVDRAPRKRLLEALDQLACEPWPPGAVKLVGQTSTWRIRVSDYRIIYTVESDEITIEVVRIGHRRDVYRRI